VYSEFRLDEGGEKTKQQGVCSFIREQWPELSESLAVDAGAKSMPRNMPAPCIGRNFYSRVHWSSGYHGEIIII
jgi:hypothetical protein